MGGQISKLFSSLIWAKKEIRILILGLVRSGPGRKQWGSQLMPMDRIMRERLHFYTD